MRKSVFVSVQGGELYVCDIGSECFTDVGQCVDEAFHQVGDTDDEKQLGDKEYEED